MVKPMEYRRIVKLLRSAGFTVGPGKGDHEKWTSLKGNHVSVRHGETASPGVVRQVLAAIKEAE